MSRLPLRRITTMLPTHFSTHLSTILPNHLRTNLPTHRLFGSKQAGAKGKGKGKSDSKTATQARDYTAEYLTIVDSTTPGTLTPSDADYISSPTEISSLYKSWQRHTTRLHNLQSSRLQSAIQLKSSAVSAVSELDPSWSHSASEDDLSRLPLSRPWAGGTPRVWDFDREEAMKEIREGKGGE
mmetsp:Transcript_11381/g.23273  ORF Transcript_11381/g.23273 Transcript_11381/m.23273 type:complete len:183 (+) Transcript_11381:144-692(+)